MTNKDISKALVATLQNRMLSNGYTNSDANAYTVGYLEQVLVNLMDMSPKVKKEVLSTLVFITNNKV